VTAEDVARIVGHGNDDSFVTRLREADAAFRDAEFEVALANALHAESSLIQQWNVWSEDQRWTPSAAVDGVRTAWILPSGRAVHERVHGDEAVAVVDFIRRMSAWLARREVLYADDAAN
jgi:hypothetical protein